MMQALVDAGSVSVAAEVLHTSQSGLSHRIKLLEALIGNPLFVRYSKPFKLTPQGQIVWDTAISVLPHLERAQNQLLDIRGGRLKIAIECHACFDWLIPTLNAFSSAQPEVDFDLSLGHSFDAFEALRQYDVDMVVTSDPLKNDAYHYFSLFKYQMLMVMSPHNALASVANVVPRMMRDQTLLSYPVKQNRLDVFKYFLNPAKVSPQHVRKVELPFMMMQHIANNQGVACLPGWALTSDQRAKYSVKQLGKHGLWRTLYLAIRKVDAPVTYMSEFAEIAKTVSFEKLDGIKTVKSLASGKIV